MTLRNRRRLSRWLVSVALVAGITGAIGVLQNYARTASLSVLYLLAVLPVAALWGMAFGLVVSVLSTVAFDFFFVPPRNAFVPADSGEWIGLAVFVVTAVVVSQLAARSREEARGAAWLAEEQAALGRVATLVARGISPGEVLVAVAGEVGRLLGADSTALLRYEPEGTAIMAAGWRQDGGRLAVEGRLTLVGENVAGRVLSTGRAARMDSYQDAPGSLGSDAREPDFHSSVGTPIVVEGRLWGVMIAGWHHERAPSAHVEARMSEFTELVATAIANANSRAELTASRARVVAAADETRRRIERDLHDGTQQRLVSLGLELRAAEAMAPLELTELKARLSGTAKGLTAAVDDLQEISRGIHPAILSRGGLGPAVKVLAERSALPVELDVAAARRLPAPIEAAAYYVVSEALTNAAKHARASAVRVDVGIEAEIVRLSISDDGVGGADPGEGSGLLGLRDRVEALGGEIAITSPAGSGTSLRVEIPIDQG